MDDHKKVFCTPLNKFCQITRKSWLWYYYQVPALLFPVQTSLLSQKMLIRFGKKHFDFLEECLSEVRRQFRIDERRIALLGISDGGSVALTLATHNPKLFQAALSVSAGFCSSPPSATKSGPKLFMLHGSHDSMFQLSRIGLPLRDKMKQLGYDVEHRVGDGHGHVPPGWQEEFLPAWLAMPVGA